MELDLRVVAAQQVAAQAIQERLAAAMQAPHRVTEVLISSVAVIDGPTAGTRVLIVGMVTGDQLRVHLNGASAALVSRALARPQV